MLSPIDIQPKCKMCGLTVTPETIVTHSQECEAHTRLDPSSKNSLVYRHTLVGTKLEKISMLAELTVSLTTLQKNSQEGRNQELKTFRGMMLPFALALLEKLGPCQLLVDAGSILSISLSNQVPPKIS